MSITNGAADRSATRHLPGPRPAPVLGPFANMALFSRDILGNVGRVFDAYGPLAAIVGGDLRRHPARARWVFARGPDHLREIMTHEALDKPPLTKGIGRRPGLESERVAALHRWGGGLFGVNGQEHKLHRRLLMPAFHKTRIDAYRDGMVAIIDEELRAWQPGTVRDLLADMRFLTLRIAARTLLGEDVRTRGEGSTGEYIQRALHLLVRPSVFLLPYDAPGFPFRRLLDVVSEMEAGIRRLIASRRASGADGTDVLSTLIHARDEGDGVLTEEQVIGHISVMLIAGHETSSNALSWMALLLTLHPRVAADLLDELNAVLGGAPPTVDQLGALPLLDAVVKEGLRLMPPAPLDARFAAVDTMVGGHAVPAGTNVLMSIYHTHRMPDFFAHPTRFLPGRWATLKPAPYSYVPFGTGPRTCIGGPFATMEIKLTLAMLLSRYRLEWIPGTRVDRFTAITLGIKGQLPMRIRAQDRAFRSAVDVRGEVREMVELPGVKRVVARAATPVVPAAASTEGSAAASRDLAPFRGQTGSPLRWSASCFEDRPMTAASPFASIAPPAADRPATAAAPPSPRVGLDLSVAVPLLVVHVLALGLAPFTFTWTGLAVAVALYLFTGFGVTAGAHRLFTHRSYKPSPLVRDLLALGFLMSAQGSLERWVRDHGIHHRFSDEAGDPHSPRLQGFVGAHLGWLWKKPPTRDEARALYTRWTRGLDLGRLGRFFRSGPRLVALHVAVVYAAYIVGAVIEAGPTPGALLHGWHTGVSVVVWGVLLRIVLVLHSTFFVNSASHVWGSRRYDTDDGSRNLWWVGIVALGEGWHNNHHEHAAAGNHGFHGWWEIDLTFLLLVALGAVGLLRDLKVWRADKGAMEVWFPSRARDGS